MTTKVRALLGFRGTAAVIVIFRVSPHSPPSSSLSSLPAQLYVGNLPVSLVAHWQGGPHWKGGREVPR